MLINLSERRAPRGQGLVDLLGECHQRIRRFINLAREAALRGDAPAEHVVQACADVERYFSVALPLHVADEEESVEPRLRGVSPEVDEALRTMVRQHQRHEAMLSALLEALAKVRSAPHDAGARTRLAVAATALEADFAEHLALEERVIFPAIRKHLSRETQAQIIHELRQRRQHGDAQVHSFTANPKESP